ncbi:thioredoxin, mitochondrial [Aplysia californica]|uniref:Thioredoxin, mitochondrial n=1 Tax=Aplysia californica TaxID=6500 RepID=A0ABM0JSU8_APLCA|nr:thioredoxin, mitochondrial [Aplysia californica]
MNHARRCVHRLVVMRPQLRSVSQSYSTLSKGMMRPLIQASRKSYRFAPAIGNKMMSGGAGDSSFEVINVQDEEDFKKRVLEASATTPIVVDFHAEWCGPCKILGPRLESLMSKEQGKVTMAKVDIDDHSDLAMEYGVRSVPTVVAIKNGKIQNQFVGVIDDDQIKAFIEKLVIS